MAKLTDTIIYGDLIVNGKGVFKESLSVEKSVSTDLIPTIDNEYELGNSIKRFKNIYAKGLFVDGKIESISDTTSNEFQLGNANTPNGFKVLSNNNIVTVSANSNNIFNIDSTGLVEYLSNILINKNTPKLDFRPTSNTQLSSINFLNSVGTLLGNFEYKNDDNYLRYYSGVDTREWFRFDNTGMQLNGLLGVNGITSNGLIQNVGTGERILRAESTNTGAVSVHLKTGADNWYMTRATGSSDLLFTKDGTNVAYLTGNTRLGIGVSPSTTIHAQGVSPELRLQSTSVGDNVISTMSFYDNGNALLGYFGYGSSSNSQLTIMNNRNADIAFYTGGVEKFKFEHSTGRLLIGANKVITEADFGPGNGIDADLLDGISSEGFVQIAGSQTITGAKTFSSLITGSISGNAGTATVLQTTRTLTIGSTGKTFNGSANVAWTLGEIGAAAASHTHVIADVTSLQSSLDAKLASSVWVPATTSTLGYMTTTQVTKLDGIAAGAQVNVATNLDYTASTRILTSSTGTNITLPQVTTTLDGLMIAADKVKLNGIETGAQVNTVTSVSGKTGAVTLVSSDVGLGNVTNHAQVQKLASSTNGNIPTWNGTAGNQLNNGYGIETTLTGGVGNIPRADAVKTYIDGLLAANDAMIFKGTLGTGGTYTVLPTTHNVGWTIKVISAGTYAGKVAEIGDIYVSLVSRTGTGNLDSDWAVLQTNIDGAVTGPSSSVNDHIALFDGTSGKIIKSSGTVLGGGTLTLATSGIATGSQTFGANQTTNATFTVNVPGTNIAQGTRTSTAVPITSSTGSNATLDAASSTLAGVMIAADKVKLDGIAAGAQVNVATNLDYTASTRILTSSTGTNVTLPQVTTTLDGVMIAADKVKLDGIAAGAQVNVATNLGITAGTTAGPVVTSSTGTNATLPTASGTASGIITTSTQTFAGVKTFSSTITGSITGNAGTATTLQTARTIGGVSFNGSANITLPGVNAAGNQNTTGSAATLTTARTLTIGSTGKTFNGSANVAWTLAEIGAAAASHNHSAADITSGTLADARLPSEQGGKTFTSNTLIRSSTANGYAILTPGNAAARPGYIGFHTSEGTRRGFIGWASGSNLLMNAENGWGWSIGGQVTFNTPPIGSGASLTSLNASNISSGTLNTARIHGGEVFKRSRPGGFWSAAEAAYADVAGIGYIGTNGAFRVAIMCNGYRNNSGTWTSRNVNSNTNMSGIELDPNGDTRIYGGAPAGTNGPLRMAINGTSGLVTAGSFGGNGAALTNLNASNISSGTLAGDRLPSNVAYLTGSQGFTSVKRFIPTINTAMNNASGSLATLEAYANGAGAAFMSFHRPGAFAAYFGIDTDNKLKVGGWSMGANAHEIWHAGTFNPASKLDTNGNGSGLTNLNASNISSGTLNTARLPATINYTLLNGAGASNRDKIRVWNASHYSMGMIAATYGHLNSWAMTFQMANGTTQGFWWGHSSHTMAQGAMSLTTDGRLYVGNLIDCVGDITAYASDIRLKSNITRITSALEKVMSIRGVEYDWNDNVEELGFHPYEKRETGLIAQELQKVLPNAVRPAPFDNEYLTIKYERVVPLLVEAIKDLKEKHSNELNSLRNEVEELKNLIRNKLNNG